MGVRDDNIDNNSYLAFARTFITVAPTLCHGREEQQKYCTTKIVVYYRKLTKIYLKR